jgi:hypothetical protein
MLRVFILFALLFALEQPAFASCFNESFLCTLNKKAGPTPNPYATVNWNRIPEPTREYRTSLRLGSNNFTSSHQQRGESRHSAARHLY